jgi:hypothetical protein
MPPAPEKLSFLWRKLIFGEKNTGYFGEGGEGLPGPVAGRDSLHGTEVIYSLFLQFRYCARRKEFVLLLRVVSFPYVTARAPGNQIARSGLSGFPCFVWPDRGHAIDGEFRFAT